MRKLIFGICGVWGFLLFFSCSTNKENAENNSSQVWAEGIQTLSGTITKVNQEKDGQSLILTNKNQMNFDVIVSIPNLNENANQYRQFEVGEFVTFKGNQLEGGTFIVREILETR